VGLLGAGGSYVGGKAMRALGESMGMSEAGILTMEAFGELGGGMLGGAAGVKTFGRPTTTLNANNVRASQKTVSFNKIDRKTGKPYTYDDIAGSMKRDGWKGDPIDVVRMKDGKLTSMDNTRLTAAREANVPVKARVHDYDTPLPKARAASLADPKKGYAPKTWGDAVSGRIQSQSGKFGVDNPHGSIMTPRVTGRPK
jgi:filamentous hemagglutinin